METNIVNKAVNASKWSAVTEIAVKLVQPLSNLILVRILAPEAFAAVATINMVVSFADIFTDAGFQKYLVQQDFSNENRKILVTNVAFWTNLTISLFLWGIILLFRNPIARLVGAPSLAGGIVIAALALPMTSFSSIQMALFRREFNFRILFFARVFTAIVPMLITIPLAFSGLGYWAIVLGTLCGKLFDAVFLTYKSKWKPRFIYSISILKEMLSFTIWTLIESITVWLTVWIGVFIVGQNMTEYYTGLYTTSINTVNSIMSIVVSATTSVLFATLSRLKNDQIEYRRVFFTFQRIVSMFVMPMGVAFFVFQKPITAILLGSQWSEAAPLVGIWGLCYSFSIVFGNLISEVYRSMGKPKLSVLAQVLHIVVLAPVCYFFSKAGDFLALSYARSLSRFEFILVHFIIVYVVFKISPLQMIRNISYYLIATVIMGIIGYILLPYCNGVAMSLFVFLLCALVYFACLMLFPASRKETFGLLAKVLKRGVRK